MLKIGIIIKNYRQGLGISQERLAYGICTPGNLSRIESGIQAPGRSTFEALMQRMGKPTDLFPSFMSESEVIIYTLKHEIRNHIRYREYEQAEKKLEKLEVFPNLDRIYRQFICYIKALLIKNKNKDYETALKILYDALSMTLPKFTTEKIASYLLTREERALINNIAIIHHIKGNTEEAITMLYALKDFYDKKVVDSDEKAVTYTTILYNLSKWLGMAKNYKEALEICDLGIKWCLKYSVLHNFPLFCYNKGCDLLGLGQKEEAIKLIHDSYFTLRLMNDTTACKIIEEFLADNNIEKNCFYSSCSGIPLYVE